MTLTVGSLFSGIGGLELGLEMAGPFQTVFQAERDPYASAVLAKHWPHATRFTDVRDVTAATVPGVDVLCGGFPCQPHSLAGKRLSSADDRDLWGEFARIIGDTQPRWVVAENVPGLLSSHDPAHGRGAGGFFGRVLRDLAQLGFDAEWHSIPAAAVGAPHLRYRVFIVAHAERWGSEADGERRELAAPAASEGRGRDQSANAPVRGGASVAYTECLGSQGSSQHRGVQGLGQAGHESTGSGAESQRGAVAVPEGDRRGSWGAWGSAGDGAWVPTAEPVQVPDWAGGAWEQPDPLVRRPERGVRDVAYGLSSRVDELRTLGNAVVPQVGAVIGRAIWEAEECRRLTGALPQQIVTRQHLEVPA